MKWTARLHHKNFIDSPSQQVSKVPKPPLDTLDTLPIGVNEKKFTITRADVERHYPDSLTLPGDCCISLSDVLDQAMPATANDSGDWPDLMNADCLQAFAQALLADSLVKPIIPATPATPATFSETTTTKPNRVAGVAEVASPTADLPLLADDHRHIDAQLCRHPRQRRTAILNEYRRVWLAAAQQEAIEHRRDNAGRRAANLYLLRLPT
ncbi:MAG: hypothetical protein KDK05_05880 [Candidatus Competibacteraceae bacterium]|nr:hypothetical protein [Candidatus Competibacteraceae bacterium]